RRRQNDFTKIRLEGENHQVVEQQVEAEGQRQGDEHRAGHHGVDEHELDQIPEAEQQSGRRRYEQERVDVEVLVGKEGRVGSEDDKRSVENIDDVENAPDQREPDCDSAEDPPQHQPFHQSLDIEHSDPAPTFFSWHLPPGTGPACASDEGSFASRLFRRSPLPLATRCSTLAPLPQGKGANPASTSTATANSTVPRWAADPPA